ncbi:hypothetical protein SELMODRAFT_414738 [Selaginella moellendorffii]|uniref:Uncharacterized protein n=1 Tax=Selaginella moellendorffii TaxID=88036 RepID=D8RTS5_SELML|nr:hypothetical protein SELMODRAFT_414738 [Selaginella moellendorffii]
MTNGDLISLEEGKAAIEDLLKLKDSDLTDPSTSTALPYPGVGRACTRPEVVLNFVGRTTVRELLIRWYESDYNYVIYGPKGVGKSSDFRALYCILFGWVHADNTNAGPIAPASALPHGNAKKKRLVYLVGETLSIAETEAMRNGLLFSFLAEGSDTVICAIEKLSSVTNVTDFVEARKQQQQEEFYFFVDGGEKLDPLDFFQGPAYDSGRKSSVSENLDRLLRTGERVWWCTGPKSRIVHDYPYSITLRLELFAYVDRGFSLPEFNTYASRCVLGKLESRLQSIEYHTGLVPLFLEALCECCGQVTRDWLDSETTSCASLRQSVGLSALLEPSEEQMVELLSEDDYWDKVLLRFAQHREISRVRKKAEAIRLEGECPDAAAMACLDATYVLDPVRGVYCSSFIERIYTRVVRAKEEKIKPYQDGAWMEYARRLSDREDVEVNWSFLGWLCEDVLANVIQKKGLVLGELKISGHITVVDFNIIPSCSIETMLKISPNNGYFYKPLDVRFPFVDAVLAWVDENSRLHIVALQYTVNIDEHIKSCWQFMSLDYLRTWFPDIDKFMTADNVKLHYVFVGCSSKPEYSGGMQEPWSRSTYETPAFQLHIQPFDDRSLPGLNAKDYKLLHEIASNRVWKTSYVDACDDGFGLLAFERVELEKMAKEKFGMRETGRKAFRNKALLINKIVEMAKGKETKH